MASRITTLLKTFHLSELFVADQETSKPELERKIKFAESIESKAFLQILSEERKRTDIFLNLALGG